MKIIIALALLTLASCVNTYEVDGTGRDWVAQPIQKLPASRVTPLVTVPLPSTIGGGSVDIPVVIKAQK